MLYEFAWYFMLYAFFGWCAEVIFAAVTTGEFVNRGFLNGPVCPIYGFGAVLIILCLAPISDHLLPLFFCSVVLTSALEWLTGFILEKIFHEKWWDYSDKPFHLNGYICLAFSLLWGLVCVFVLRILHPLVVRLIPIIPFWLGCTLIIALFCILLADTLYTILAAKGLHKELRSLQSLVSSMRRLSDEIGENLSENTFAVMEKNKERIQALDRKKAAFDKRLQDMPKRYRIAAERITRAFPKLKAADLSELRKKAEQRVNDWRNRSGKV